MKKITEHRMIYQEDLNELCIRLGRMGIVETNELYMTFLQLPIKCSDNLDNDLLYRMAWIIMNNTTIP